ncbi:hypothetical protein AB1Y20_009882 [Prymnesium parvum]|uniref:Peptide-O-fucosyltransferase 1 n=1 Tax=Prymnesium parvum TaxID=97485 RepID=A0AB34K1N7_PRYPA
MALAESPRFLVVHTAGDGMTRWSVALAETISFAISNNLTMVEPCVQNGRIQPCEGEALAAAARRDAAAPSDAARALGTPGALRPLSAYRNATAQFRALFPQLAHFLMPYTEFLRDWNGEALLQQSRLVCAAYMSSAGCNQSYQRNVWSDHIVGNSKEQRRPQALLRRVRGQPVLRLYYLRTGFFERNRSLMGRIYQGLSTFAPALEAVAATLPAALGLQPGYFAYHWRSEKKCHNYDGCSRQLLATKRRLEESHADARRRALLISDISATNQSLWGGMSIGGHLHSVALRDGASTALHRLLHANMTKLETLPEMANVDSGALSVLDLLLGARAGFLVTCASQHAPCARTCAWVGGYANTLRVLRRGRNMTYEW